MNSLSILIYAIGVISGIGFLIGTVIVACVIALVIAGINYGNGNIDGPLMRKLAFRLSIGAFAALLIGSFIPSQRTMILIVASEVGQRILQNDQAQAMVKDLGGLGSETTDLLRTYIRKQTLDLKTEMEKK